MVLSYMLFCKRSGIETIAESLLGMDEVILDSILNKKITAGEYKALFGVYDLSEKILDLQNARKKTAFLARKNAVNVRDPEEMKMLSKNFQDQFHNFDFVTRFLEKAKRDNPDAVCGCYSVSCTETHAE